MKRVRGYIFSRNFMGERVPQHVQNIIIRDYCNRNDLQYLLSSVEYSFNGSKLILQDLLDNEADRVDGFVFYSIFQLPEDNKIRAMVYEAVMNKKIALHFANETLSIKNLSEVKRIERIWMTKKALIKCMTDNELNVLKKWT